MSPDKLAALWEEIKRRVKHDGELNPPLWRALDASRPITLDHLTLVVGLPHDQAHEGSHFDVGENRALLESILANVGSKPLAFCWIEGTNILDYEHWKARQEAAEAYRKQFEKPGGKKPAASGEGDDDASEADDAEEDQSIQRMVLALNRELHVRYRDISQRSQTYVKANFIRSCFPDLMALEQKVWAQDGREELKLRQMSRAIDRVSDMLHVDALLVALEYERFKTDQQG